MCKTLVASRSDIRAILNQALSSASSYTSAEVTEKVVQSFVGTQVNMVSKTDTEFLFRLPDDSRIAGKTKYKIFKSLSALTDDTTSVKLTDSSDSDDIGEQPNGLLVTYTFKPAEASVVAVPAE